jgi:hypothetical protein
MSDLTDELQKILKNFTEKDLEGEISRRRELRRMIPKPVADPDWSPLVKILVDMINRAVEEQYWNDDNDHYIVEKVMETSFGSGYWDWLRHQKW